MWNRRTLVWAATAGGMACQPAGGGVVNEADTPKVEVPEAAPGASAPAPEAAVVEVGLEAPADVGGPPADATVEASGLASRVLRRGRGGARPGVNDMVVVRYTGWKKDGTRFDSSITRNKTARFPVNA